MEWTFYILITLLGLLAVFQIALALGAPLGKFAWGGQYPEKLPKKYRLASLISVALIAVFIIIVLNQAGAISLLPSTVSSVGMWVVVIYLGISIPLNAISRSKPERIWAPYSFIMLLCAIPLL